MALLDSSDSSGSSSDSEVESDELGPESQTANEIPSPLSGETFSSRVEDMGTKLDALVRHIKRNVEGLAPAESESTFSILAFVLEDWDR